MTTWNDTQALEAAKEMGISSSEYDAIRDRIERTPNQFELAVFAGMWSEHCSYKTTRSRLRAMPKNGDAVLAGPGSHAGVVDVGEGWGLAFKIESHNHPSAVEPYQGAATGVGGILRDIVAQGARPVAVMDSLCFGVADSPRTRHLREGVVAGIAGYGNAFGVPNIGGRVRYDARYDGNPLVNALAAGLVRHDEMRSAEARGVGNPVLYVGARTGRDGILGAAFASVELADDTTEQRSHVQVGDPYTGKKLMEALLRFEVEDGLIACQDMGATGLTCAASEMAEAGSVGIELWLDRVPLRDERMSPEEILVSESQERFLLVIEKGREDEAVRHFRHFGVEAAICGEVIADDRFVARHRDRVVVDLPASLVAEGCPESHLAVADALPDPEPYVDFKRPEDLGVILHALLRDPNTASPHQIYQRYDSTVGNRTVRGPGQAEVAVQVLPSSVRGYALTITGRGDVCAADPYLGAKAALGEACRNLACVGARLIAITDGLNMGSPTDPVENLRLSETIRGLADGLKELEIPVTGGNVSLYNESPRGAIPPTPMIGAVGTLEDVQRVPDGYLNDGDLLFALGELDDAPAYSAYGNLMAERGRPHPSVALEHDRRLAGFLCAAVDQHLVRAGKDAGRGGLAVALAKLAVGSSVGVDIDITFSGRLDRALFGESSGLAWIAVHPEDEERVVQLAQSHRLPAQVAGRAGGQSVRIAGLLETKLDALRESFYGARSERG